MAARARLSRQRAWKFVRWPLTLLAIAVGLGVTASDAHAQFYRAPTVQSTTVSVPLNQLYSMSPPQRVVSNSDFTATYRLALSCPPQLTGCSWSPGQQDIAPHDGANYAVSFTATANGQYTIYVSATDDAHSLTGNGTITVNVGPPQVTVGPKGAPAVNQAESQTGVTQVFTLSTPAGSPTTTYNLSIPTCSGAGISNCQVQATASVTGGTPTNVTVTYNTLLGPSSGQVTLQATNGAVSDQATQAINVTTNVPPYAATAAPTNGQTTVTQAAYSAQNTTFTITHTGYQSNAVYSITASCALPLTNCSVSPAATQGLSRNGQAIATISYTTAGYSTSAQVTLTVNGNGIQTVQSVVTVNTPGPPQVTVGPKGAPAVNQPESQTGVTQNFTLSTPAGSPTTTFNLSIPTCSGTGISNCQVQATANVTGGTPTTVPVTYNTLLGPSSGQITLQAVNGTSTDQATQAINVTTNAPAYAATVAPTTGQSTVTQTQNSAQNTTFTITHTGYTANAVYTISASCGGALTNCSVNPTSTQPLTARGGQGYATVSYTTGGYSTSGTATLTVSGNGIAPVTSTVTVNTPPPAPNVTPDGVTTLYVNRGGSTTLSFRVQNPGPTASSYTLSVSCGGATLTGVTCSAPTSPHSVNAGATDTIPVTVTANASATATGTGVVQLTATGAGGSDVGSYNVVLDVPPSVTPVSGTVSINPLTKQSSVFTIKNMNLAGNRTYKVVVTCPTSVSSCGVTKPSGGPIRDATDPIAPGATFPVTVTYVAKGTPALSGPMKIKAMNVLDPTDTSVAQLTITVASYPAVTVISHMQGLDGSIARDACLDMALGKGASYECGDVRAAYTFPAMTTMNSTRQPTLLFVSSHANASAVIEADVAMGTGMTPSSIVPTLKVNGVTQTGVPASFFWDPAWPTGVPRRITIPVDGSALPLSSGAYAGVYKYSLEIAATVGGVTTRQSDSGLVTIVNRINSPFGRGWWLEGYEQVVTPVDTSTRLWVGGDGSTRLYSRDPNNANRWIVASMLNRPDTMLYTGTVYQRLLPNGVRTEFDGSGNHLRTISYRGDTTSFTYVGGLLDRINLALPTGVSSGPYYQFHYATFAGAASRLDTVHLKGPSVTDRFTTLSVGSNGWVGNFRFLAATDTETRKTQYDYNPASGSVPNAPARDLAKITDPANQVTTFGYVSRKLVQVRTVMATPAEDIYYAFRPAELIARDTVDKTPALLSNAVTWIDGPRSDGDTTLFYTNRFGAPDTVVGRLYHGVRQTTRFTRDVLFPLLANSTIQPNGLTTNVALNSRGLPDTVTTVNPLGAAQGSAITTFAWHGTWNLPVSVKTPTNEVTTYDYDTSKPLRIWETDARGATGYHYDARSRLDVITPPSNDNPTTASITLTYDATLGNLATTSSWVGTTDQLYRNAIGQVTGRRSPIGSIAFRYDSTTYWKSGLVYQQVSSAPGLNARPESLTVTYVYDSTGLVRSVRRDVGNDARRNAPKPPLLTTFTYDKAGRKLTEQGPDGKVTRSRYDQAGNVVAIWPKARTEFADSIIMVYDTLNRLSKRIVPSVTYQPLTSALQSSDFGPMGYYGTVINTELLPLSFFTHPYPQYPNGTGNTYVTPADTTTYSYNDTTNAMLSATNVDGRVYRTYYPNGSILTETQQIADTGRTTFALHSDTVRYQYDLSGRRTELYHPIRLRQGATRDRTSWTYDAAGALSTVTDVQGNVFTYNYHPDGSLKSLAHGNASGVLETFDYDPDGRLLTSGVSNTGTSPYKWQTPSGTLRTESYGFDVRSKLTSVSSTGGFANNRTMKYSGLGYLTYSDVSMESPRYGCCQPMAHITETYETDGLGNTDTTSRVESGTMFGPSYSDGYSVPAEIQIHWYDAMLRQVQTWHSQSGDAVDTLIYDGAGNREWTYQKQLATPPARYRDERRSYYGADGKLRADDHRQLFDGQKRYTATFEQYRYDPLGRRTWVETRQYCEGGTNDANPLCRFSKIRRVIWDGSQELYEIQMPDSTIGTFDARENDTTNVPRMAPYMDPYPPGYQLKIDPNRLFGRVAYAYGAGLDQPLSVTRFKYVSTMDLHNATTWQPTEYPTEIRDTVISFFPIWNYQGKAELGVFPDGGATRCVTVPRTNCIDVFWPRMFSAYRQETNYGIRTAWHGSLVEDRTDASGLIYQRNRMYDPAIGKFTQADPLGLAGGMNLYGYANGDPVNYSDPFGLHECTPANLKDCKLLQITVGAKAKPEFKAGEYVKLEGPGVGVSKTWTLTPNGSHWEPAKAEATFGAVKVESGPVQAGFHVSCSTDNKDICGASVGGSIGGAGKSISTSGDVDAGSVESGHKGDYTTAVGTIGITINPGDIYTTVKGMMQNATDDVGNFFGSLIPNGLPHIQFNIKEHTEGGDDNQ